MDVSRNVSFLILIFCIIICFITPNAFGIKCYECNSEYDPRCADPFDAYSIGEVDCDRKPKLSHINNTAILCRKIAQKANGKARVVRSCGYLPSEDNQPSCILRSGTYEVNMQYCACQGDLCNASNTRKISLLLLMVAVKNFISILL